MINKPSQDQIKEARANAGLSQTEAAKLIYSTLRTWQDWEAGKAKMHQGLWELFNLKTASNEALRGAMERVMEWISVEDRLPERYTEVMVWPHPSDQVMTAQFGLMRKESAPCWHFSEYESNHGWDERECNPTHWMPLPDAPEQEAMP